MRFWSEHLTFSLEPADTAAQANKFPRIPAWQPALGAGLTRTLGRSGGSSDTMLWLDMSLLVAVRFPPALLDMSKADLLSSWPQEKKETSQNQETMETTHPFSHPATHCSSISTKFDPLSAIKRSSQLLPQFFWHYMPAILDILLFLSCKVIFKTSTLRLWNSFSF